MTPDANACASPSLANCSLGELNLHKGVGVLPWRAAFADRLARTGGCPSSASALLNAASYALVSRLGGNRLRSTARTSVAKIC
jgi:hypothetical protein